MGQLAVPAPDHKCTSTIAISLDALTSALTMLPRMFCFGVQVPEVSTPAPRRATGVEVLDIPALSPLTFGILHQYGIDSSVTVAVIDHHCDGAQLLQSVLTPGLPPQKLVVFVTGKGQVYNPPAGLTVVEGLPSVQIFGALVHCRRHLVVGSLLGWWAAVLSGSESVRYSDPWRLGSPSLTDVHPSWTPVSWNWTDSPYFSQAYYINLDRRPDRRAHMESQLARYHMSATRISAVDGKTIPWKIDYGYLSDFWNNGALAYCLSYREIIVDAISRDYENILIMDDDAVLTDLPEATWLETLARAWSELPEEWHMLYLAANHGTTKTPTQRIGSHLYRLTGSLGSHAIILNRKCFKYLLHYLSAPYLPLDTYFSLYQQFFPCYITYPGLATQLPGVSDIIGKDVDYKKDWGIDYIHWGVNPPTPLQ